MRNLLIGKKTITENINKEIISIHSIGNFPKIKDLSREYKIPYFVHNDDKFFLKFDINHQGIIAFLKNTDYVTNDFDYWYSKIKNKNNKIVVVLDGVEDVGNFGAIIRTCDCFGVDGIIIKNSNQAPINDVVVKNSMGAIYSSNILIVQNISAVIEEMKKLNFWTVASTLKKSENYSDIPYDFNCCLIIGSESNGVSKKIIDNSDYRVKIPMHGIVDSLNVSVATGILLSYITLKNK